MSRYNNEEFNIWFPAIVCGLLISLIAAAIWDIFRRRFWSCVSRLWPSVLGEVGLDDLSRVELEKKNQLKINMLSSVYNEVIKSQESLSLEMTKVIDLIAVESFNSSNSSISSNNDFDLEGQKPIFHPFSTPTGRPITFTTIAYFADGTPTFVIRPVKRLFKKYGNGTVKRWKSSIVLQASLPIEASVVGEIEELARISILEENKCTFQLGNWAILYYKAGEVCLHEMKEGDVPLNVEARWQDKITGIKMRGLYLNGAQVKVATKHTSNILRSVGPATKGHGDLDELNFNIEDLDVPREDAIIFASKLIDGDGISLLVRSEATFIRPTWAKFTVTEAFWSQLQWISRIAKMMMKLLVRDEDCQSEAAETLPDLILDQEQCQHIVQHWKGVLEIEILEIRKDVLHDLQELRESGESYSTMSHLSCIRDRHSVGYWERVLQELNEIILQHEGCSQSGTYIRIRGGVRFLLGNYEDALHDMDRAHLIMQDDHWTKLYERALVKCMLARYSEALEDVCSVMPMNPNFSDIQELKTCIQHILEQKTPLPTVQDNLSSLLEQPQSMVDMHILEQQTPLPTIQDGSSRLLEQRHFMVDMHILEQQEPLPTVHDGSSSLLQQPQSTVEIAVYEMHSLDQRTPIQAVQDGSSSLPAQPQTVVKIPDLLTRDAWDSRGKMKVGDNKIDDGRKKDGGNKQLQHYYPVCQKTHHEWQAAVSADERQKCEKKVIEEIREVHGVFDVGGERLQSKVVVVSNPTGLDEYGVLMKARKVDKKARKVDKKAKFVTLDDEEKNLRKESESPMYPTMPAPVYNAPGKYRYNAPSDYLSKIFLPQLNRHIWSASFEPQRFYVQRVIVCAAEISHDEAVIHELLTKLPSWATTQENLDWQPDDERRSLGDVCQHLQTMTSSGRDSSGRDCPNPDHFLFKEVESSDATRFTCSHSFRLSSLGICNAETPKGYLIGATYLKKLSGFERKEYECELWSKLLFEYLIKMDDDSPGIKWKGRKVPTAVVWQVQLDIVDTWRPSCGSKRRGYGALPQVPELPAPPEKQQKGVKSPRGQKGDCMSEYKGVRYRPDRGTWVAETRLPAEEKLKNKVPFGDYKSDYEAARAVDAALYYYRKGSYNFPDSPELLKTQPSLEGLKGIEKRKAVKERAKWLADNAPHPSTSPPSSPVPTTETVASPGHSRSNLGESDESGGIVVDDMINDLLEPFAFQAVDNQCKERILSSFEVMSMLFDEPYEASTPSWIQTSMLIEGR